MTTIAAESPRNATSKPRRARFGRRAWAFALVTAVILAFTVVPAPKAHAAVRDYALAPPGAAPAQAYAARDFWADPNRTPGNSIYHWINPPWLNGRNFPANAVWPQHPPYRGGSVYRYFFNGPNPNPPLGLPNPRRDRWIATGGVFQNTTLPGCANYHLGAPHGYQPFDPPGPFYEYDVTASASAAYRGGSHRGMERLVLDANDGSVYYTDDHYCTFRLL